MDDVVFFPGPSAGLARRGKFTANSRRTSAAFNSTRSLRFSSSNSATRASWGGAGSGGWHTKSWTTRKGTPCGGFAFDKNRLYGLLTNITYTGKLTYKDEVHDGRHEAIVTTEVFKQVQAILRHNGNNGGSDVRGGYRALLKGLLFCGPCGCAMSHTYTQRGKTRYCYYVCLHAQKRGWSTCPSKSLPAAEIERFVVDHIRGVGRDPRVVAKTVAEVRRQIEGAIAELDGQEKRLTQEISKCDRELRRLIADVNPKTGQCRKPDALADAQSRISEAQQRAREVRAEVLRLKNQLVDEAEVKVALAALISLTTASVQPPLGEK